MFASMPPISGVGVVASGSVSLLKITTAAVTATATVSFVNDGSVTYVNGSGLAAWFSQIIAGIGGSHWARLTLGTAPAPTSGPAAGSWASLSAGAAWNWQALNQIKVGTFTVDISDSAAGTVIRGTYSGNVDVESTG